MSLARFSVPQVGPPASRVLARDSTLRSSSRAAAAKSGLTTRPRRFYGNCYPFHGAKPDHHSTTGIPTGHSARTLSLDPQAIDVRRY
jgi:hypothetical protein